MSKLSTLPDPCLFGILHHLPVIDQLSLGKVCRRLRLLQVSVFSQQTKLELFISHNYYNHYNESKYKLDSFNKYENKLQVQAIPTCDQIVETFPNITQFKLVYEDYLTLWKWMLDSTVNLLQHEWSLKLVSLELKFYYTPLESVFPEDSLLIKSFNSLTLLKHLSLKIGFHQLKQLSVVLPRLESIELELNCGLSEVIAFLKLINTDRLKHIRVRCIETNLNNNIPVCFQLDQEIAHKIEELSLTSNIKINNQELLRYCAHFNSLRAINIGFSPDELSFIERLNCLVELKRLSRLILSLVSISLTMPCQIIPLQSVHRLKLYISSNTPKKVFYTFKVNIHFPNVELIEICLLLESNCNVCGRVLLSLDTVVPIDQERECIQHFIEPLKSCEKLKQIHVKLSSFSEWQTKAPFDQVECVKQRS